MTVPEASAYVEALQNPALTLADPTLRGVSVELNRQGLPRPIAGNFSCVFRATTADGRRYALKCFTRDVADQHRRYDAVSRALAVLDAPWKVTFEYQPRGILTACGWQPLVKMDWVAGDLLDRWTADHLEEPERLLRAAAAVISAATDLEIARMSHGDLQHGNVVVLADDSIRLIDYDGMFVPELADLASTESGHPNYQAATGPARFGPGRDCFSAWVIVLSLGALARAPQLWATHGELGERLLFKSSDFRSPPTSSLFADLAAVAPDLGELAQNLVSTPEDRLALPSIEQIAPPAANVLLVTTTRSAEASGRLPQWMVGPLVPGLAESALSPAQAVGSAWVETHRPPLPARSFEWPWLPRIITIALGIALLSALPIARLTGDPALAIAGAIGVVVAWPALTALGYLADPVRRDRRAARRSLTNVQRQPESIERRFVADRNRPLERLNADLRAVDARQEVVRASITTRRSARLEEIQASHVRQQLSRHSVTGSGVRASAHYLEQAGIRTAADFVAYRTHASRYLAPSGRYGLTTITELQRSDGSWTRVYSIGPKRARRLDDWRRAALKSAEASMPTSLPAQDEQIVAAELAADLAALDAERARLRDQFHRMSQARPTDRIDVPAPRDVIAAERLAAAYHNIRYLRYVMMSVGVK